ncbi:DEAD/DEAH box helicase [Pokkaliibacter plantistimulans]|uniref:DEAD/DEAH box helicase n=1 Tax=Proteobacteria bacterium 228 TaxID=2083153 RepID=A0A2S5KV95_9PROT|nr:DEAD/DEAH box helicase [Pokkaliibacter plantistimulans]PPC78572.1 DEAD/DEAH box helicase [Pokkaliibacter plantistimulans]
MRFFRSLIEQSLERTREATLGVLSINHPGLRRHLSESMVNTLGAEGCFLASPVFEHTFGWREAELRLQDLPSEGLLSNSLLDTLASAPAYRFPKTAHPYVHQLQAWRTLLNEQPRSAVITTGTGSGKTECFMVPILEDLVREHERSEAALVGVRALFLYPLNALINSQQERLDAWTHIYGNNIRFCLYNGKTEERADKVRKEQQQKPNQILSRELLRKEPAPILMTNATMLEYMLVRQVDNPILEISKQQRSLRWIVLDEAHTYVGSQAAEMSLLLRRVVQAFGTQSEQIRFIATSATIAGADAQERLKRYLADLAGVPLEQVEVIGGARVWPNLVFDSAGNNTSLQAIRDIEPRTAVSAARFKALCDSVIARSLRHAVVSSDKPLDLQDLISTVSNQLQGGSPLEQQQEVLDWLDTMTGTHLGEGQPPFLKLRIHLFQRMLHGLWACVDPQCSVKSNHLQGWPFGNVYVTQRARCECFAPVYELGFCNECKTPHLLAEDRNGELHQPSPYAGDEFALNHEHDGEDTPAELLTAHASNTRLIIAGFLAAHDPYFPITLDLESQKLGAVSATRNIGIVLTEEKDGCCSHCDNSSLGTSDFLRKAYLGAPFYIANAVPTVLEFCPDPDKADCEGRSPEELPGRGRKLITFTDSRQGTARMAVRMQQEAERSRLRGLVFETLRNAQTKQYDLQPMFPAGYQQLLDAANLLEKLNQYDEAKKIRLQAESLTPAPTQPLQISWQALAQTLAACRDIDQFILRYNRYANPALFDGSEGGLTMARLLLAREFSRRPKNQNSTETLGLIKVSYQGLEKVTTTPPLWVDTLATPALGAVNDPRSVLTLDDWHDFLKVALDFYVRENTFIPMENTMRRWMGSRFSPKALYSPKSDVQESSTIRKWPQIKPGAPHRLIKLLELATGLNRAMNADADKINSWLEAAWLALVKAGILESSDTGHRLRLETLTFSLPTEGWVCPLTRRIFDTTFRGLTPYLPQKLLSQDYRCQKIQLPALSSLMLDGSPIPKQVQIRQLVARDPVIAQLRQESLWTDISDRTVEGGFYYRTAEHSAQQSAKRLDDYVEEFKCGDINVLSCSTTMEMGVDIGGISAVVMNNLPPHPANYLQRAGRAGRRSEARAIAYTLCKADPHNQRAFAQPKWPFVTAIPAPNITLSSARIVQRHVNSLLLALFLRMHSSNDGDRTKLTLHWFFTSDDSPARQLMAWLASSPDEFKASVRQLARGTCLEGRSLSSITGETQMALHSLEESWLGEYRNINHKLQAANDGPYKKALALEKQRHEEEYLLRYLASSAFLPGYGFPTDVVNLKTYNVEDFVHKQKKSDNSREDSIFDNKEMPARSLNIAIREYAPGAQVVIDGRVYRSAGISLQWHADGQVNEAQKFDIAWRCPECGNTGVIENAYANNDGLCCSHCKTAIPPNERRMVLRPEGFLTDFYEETTNDVTSQKFIRVERPRIQLNGESISLPDQRCGFVRFGHEGSVFHHSSGEHEKGYAVCMTCGRADSMLASGEAPKDMLPDKTHRPVGGLAGVHKEHDCSGEAVKTSLHLGYQIRTDVLEIFLKNPLTGEWLPDTAKGRLIATTLGVAMRDVIADQLGIASSEMGFSYRLDRDREGGQGRCVIQLFDEVSGGAGFVLEGLSDIPKLIVKAEKHLLCPAECENVCSHCLVGQDSQVEREELDRRLALEWLRESKLVEYLELPDIFANLHGARHCSVGPARELRSIINSLNHSDQTASLLVCLHGNHQDWDLDHPRVREQILTWAITERLKVRVGIADQALLTAEQKETLALLSRLGVELIELQTEALQIPYLVVQLSSQSGVRSLYSSMNIVGTPGAHWLQGHSDVVWVTSKLMPSVSGSIIDSSAWSQHPQGARIVEVTSELDGPVNTLKKRISMLISSQMPELASLIANDQAVSISYSDRYLKSPWSLMLLSSFLELFRSEKLQTLSVQTLAPIGSQQSYLLNHDWVRISDQEETLKLWLKSQFDITLNISIMNSPRDVLHCRVITVNWNSGRTSKILLDQGMGYWRGRMPYKEQMGFDFHASPYEQVLQMVDKLSFAQMQQSGEWPTYISFSMS